MPSDRETLVAFVKALPACQNILMRALYRGTDVPIYTLFRKIYIHRAEHREQQQLVGAHISRINRKLRAHGYEVKPGVSRRSYRMRPIGQ